MRPGLSPRKHPCPWEKAEVGSYLSFQGEMPRTRTRGPRREKRKGKTDMRRWVTWTVALLGLGVGAGCEKKEEPRAEAPPVEQRGAEGDAMQELRQQTEQLAERAGETAGTARRAAEQESAAVRERAEGLAREVREGAGEAVEEIGERGEALGRELSGDVVEGVVADVREDRLLLRGPEGKRIVLRTDERTQVLRDGRRIRQESIQPGSEVRASYILEGEERVARRVEVEEPEAP